MTETMTSMTTHVTPALVEAMDLLDQATVVDIGGGQGTRLIRGAISG